MTHLDSSHSLASRVSVFPVYQSHGQPVVPVAVQVRTGRAHERVEFLSITEALAIVERMERVHETHELAPGWDGETFDFQMIVWSDGTASWCAWRSAWTHRGAERLTAVMFQNAGNTFAKMDCTPFGQSSGGAS